MDKVVSNIKRNFTGIKAVPRIIIVAACLFFFFTTMYEDQVLNINQGMKLSWSALDGSFFRTLASSSASYGYTIYLIYALWGLPVAAILKITGLGVDFRNAPIYLWFKILLLAFAVLSIIILYKLAKEVIDEDREELLWGYAGSVLLVIPVTAIAQCDIMSLCVVMLGVYFYIRDDHKFFFLCFAIAMTMKFFAALIFIPLVLLRWKGFLKILGGLAAGCSLAVLTIGIQRLMPSASRTWAAGKSYYVAGIIYRFADVKFDLGFLMGEVGLFGLFYMLLCAGAYVARVREDEKWPKYVIWFVMTSYFVFFLFFPAYTYWYVLLAPYLLLSAYLNRQNRVIVTALGIVFEVYWLIKGFVKFYWVFFTTNNLSYLCIKGILKNVTTDSISKSVCEALTGNRYFLEDFYPLFQGIGYAAALGIIVLSFPGIGEKLLGRNLDKNIKIDNSNMKVLTWIRPLILLALCLIEGIAAVVWT